jgi:hypothetical protein
VKIASFSIVVCWLTVAANAQVAVSPQVRTMAAADGKVTVVDIGAHFVSVLRLPEPVNSIAVGDPALFLVEHSEREPELVLVKALTEHGSETNLLVSTTHGRQFSFLLVNRGSVVTSPKVDFLLQYRAAANFLVEPDVVPFPMVGQTTPIMKPGPSSALTGHGAIQPSLIPTAALSTTTTEDPGSTAAATPSVAPSLDDLLRRQQTAPLPVLYGERIGEETVKGDRLRVGVSEVLDGGDQVTVLFSIVNASKHAILLMAPLVQLGGKTKTGKLF